MTVTIQSFVNHLENEVRKSPNTVSTYKRSLDTFKDFCERHGATDWNVENPHAFVDERIDAGLSASSINNALCAIRAFYRYLIAGGHCTSNPFANIVVPEIRKQISPDMLLDKEQVEALLDVQGNNLYAIRDKAILQLFYSSGIRLAELVSLNIDDLALAREDAFVHIRNGKGRKERHVRIGMNAVTAINSWLEVRNELAVDGESALFVSRVGIRPAARSIRSMVAKRGMESIGIHVHPHMIRRAYATHFIAGGGDAFCLRDNMGHSFIVTTERYVAMDNTARSGIYDRVFPQG